MPGVKPMRRLQPPDLLRLWERGSGLHSIDRALLTVAAAAPGRDRDELARLPLGERDALLLAVRRTTLGDRIRAHERCPGCGERVELDLSCAALVDDGEDPGPERWEIEHGDLRMTLRVLDSLDAAAAATAAAEGGAAAVRRELLARAVYSVERDGRSVDVEELGPDAVAAVAASLAAHDRRAELLLDVACPACAHAWQPILDVATFVWAELAARAERLLEDVHLLARAYGWREADILTLSEPRRAAYLALAAR
jgi:hypothetical protein